MSIRDDIRDRCSERRLFLVQPRTTGHPCLRTVFASEVVWRALCGPWLSVDHERRLGFARASLDNFIEGRVIAVRFPPSKSVDAFIALLDGSRQEVWEIRTRSPKPGVRILGCFAEADVFVALLPIYRESLRKSRDWHDAILRCRTEWGNLFLSERPHIGNYPNDYVTSNFFLV